MKRAAFLVLALLALAPSFVRAQGILTEEPLWGPTVRLTPFVGQAPTVNRTDRWLVTSGGAIVSQGEYDVDLGAGQAVGASLEVRVVDRFAIVGAGYFMNRGDTREYSQSAGEFIVSEGSDFLVGKLALALRLREAMSEMQMRRLTATIFAGPAYLREMPAERGVPALDESLGHWAANIGVDAEIPLGEGSVALQLGLEDFYTFWNTAEIARRNDAAFAAGGFTTQSTVEADASNMILVRLGLSFRFR